MRLTVEDVETIERATLAAVAPLELVEDDGWLLAANEGVIGRANSVAAVNTGSDSLGAKISRAIAFYEARCLRPTFRLSSWSRPEPIASALTERGFVGRDPVLVMTAEARTVVGETNDVVAVSFADRPDEAWRELFLGPGVAASEAEKRIAALARGRGMRFANLCEGEEIVAVGVCGVAGEWAGIHGMRTKPAHRRRGHARKILRGLAAIAEVEGASRMFLQVEADNAPAIKLYEALGFEEAYQYAYWRGQR